MTSNSARYLRSIVPNGLSVVRLLLGVAFPWLPADWRIGVLVVAVLSDFFDGATSRQLNAGSTLGRILDPVADKVFVLAVVLTLLHEGSLYLWEIVLIGVRDLAVAFLAVVLLFRHASGSFRRVQARWLGKATTAALFLLLLTVFAERPERSVTFVVTASLSILSAADYLWVFCRSARPSSSVAADAARPGADVVS